MKIILITPAFPPYEGSHTQRMIAIANSLVSNGIDVGIITMEEMKGHPNYNPNSSLNYDRRIQVYRTTAGPLHKKAYEQVARGNDTQNVSRKKVNRIKILVNRYKKNLMIPDTMIDWFFPALQFIKKNKIIESFKPDYIYSCSMPNTCHLIGYRISKQYGIPLIMDYGDPWVYIAGYSFNRLRFLFERKMESMILKHSKLISFSTRGCELLYQNKFSLDPSKTITAMTGYDRKLLDVAQSFMPGHHDGLIMTYGGAIQVNVRDPIPFFKAVDSFTDASITVNIRTDNIAYIQSVVDQNTRCGKIKVDGYLPFNEYYHEMLSADVLVFFGNSTSDQLPGKIFNYIPTNKIIFYICNSANYNSDQAINIVKDYGKAVIVKNDYNEIKKGLYAIIGMLGRDIIVDSGKIEKYSTDYQMNKLAHAIQELS